MGNEGAMQVALERQFFLRPAELGAKPADVVGQDVPDRQLLRRDVRLFHALNSRRLMLLRQPRLRHNAEPRRALWNKYRDVKTREIPIMKCANHLTMDAVGICTGCSRALCPECQVGIEQVLCGICLVAHNRQVIQGFYKQLALSALCGLVAVILLVGSTLPGDRVVLFTIMATFFPFGWTALSKYFSPGGGYFRATARWLSLAMHIATAALLGCVVGPYQIYVAIREIRKGKLANTLVQKG